MTSAAMPLQRARKQSGQMPTPSEIQQIDGDRDPQHPVGVAKELETVQQTAHFAGIFSARQNFASGTSSGTNKAPAIINAIAIAHGQVSRPAAENIWPSEALSDIIAGFRIGFTKRNHFSGGSSRPGDDSKGMRYANPLRSNRRRWHRGNVVGTLTRSQTGEKGSLQFGSVAVAAWS